MGQLCLPTMSNVSTFFSLDVSTPKNLGRSHKVWIVVKTLWCRPNNIGRPTPTSFSEYVHRRKNYPKRRILNVPKILVALTPMLCVRARMLLIHLQVRYIKNRSKIFSVRLVLKPLLFNYIHWKIHCIGLHWKIYISTLNSKKSSTLYSEGGLVALWLAYPLIFRTDFWCLIFLLRIKIVRCRKCVTQEVLQ